jgi:hypothetical protein
MKHGCNNKQLQFSAGFNYASGTTSPAAEKVEATADNVHLISSEVEAHDACEEIVSNRGGIFALDLEGRDLGRDGPISIVQLASLQEHADAATCPVYIFDISAATADIFSCGLKSILEDATIKKLMFDCRHDADALQKRHNVHLSGVIDLQLMDAKQRIEGDLEDDMEDAAFDSEEALSRTLRLNQLMDDPRLVQFSRSQQRELIRLRSCLHIGNVMGQPQLYVDVHRLSGLAELMNALDIGDSTLKGSVRNRYRSDPDYWMRRPLPREAIGYAAQDVRVLFDVAAALAVRGFTDSVADRMRDGGMYSLIRSVTQNSELREQTKRYADVFRNADFSGGRQKYFDHALLPQGIIGGGAAPKSQGSRMTFSTGSVTCECCLREFPRSLFPKKLPPKKRCAVCRAIDIHESTKRQWAEDEERLGDQECGYDSDYD